MLKIISVMLSTWNCLDG